MLIGEPKWWKVLLNNVWLILPLLTLLGILGGIFIEGIIDDLSRKEKTSKTAIEEATRK